MTYGPRMHSSPLLVDLGLETRRRHAERSAPVLGLVGFVAAEQDDAARLGHAEHVVPQLGVGRPHVGRHDRVQVAAAHRRQVAVAEAADAGPDERCPRRNRLSWWALSASSRSSVSPASAALEHTSVASGDQGGQQPKANPPIQKNGELQNSLSSAVSPRIALRFCWCPSSAAWVCTTPLGARGGARRVDDRQRIGSVDVGFHRRRAAPRRPSAVRARRRSATWRSSGMAERVDVGEPCRGSRCRGTTTWRAGSSTSLWASWSPSSGAVANVVNGTTTAPIRAAASIPTTKSGPFG